MTTATLILALLALPAAGPADTPVILDFYTTTCGPCQQMAPAIEMLKSKGYPVKKINLETSPELGARYHVEAVPTFIVVDRQWQELARTEGLQDPGNIASLYNKAYTKLASARAEEEPDAAEADESFDTEIASEEPDQDDQGLQFTETRNAPKPWETGVRIRIFGPGRTVGLGSGTIVHSTADEAVILTCAHIFKVDGARTQYPPSKFPLRIEVDLFDGVLHGSPDHPSLHPTDTIAGQAIDYDFNTDVGLIRIRPGASWPPRRSCRSIGSPSAA